MASAMRQRQSSLPLEDEENNREPSTRPPLPKKRRRGRKKYSKSAQYKLLLFLSLPMVAAVVMLWIAIHYSSNDKYASRSIVRRPLFQPEIGASTKCQETLHLSRELLDKSLALGTSYLMNHQTSEGSFHYEYDWQTDQISKDDQEVRQASALWGLALIFHDQMDSVSAENDVTVESSIVIKQTAARVQRGIDFWKAHSELLPDSNIRYVLYDEEDIHDTGTHALICLTLVDFLRGLRTPQEAAIAGITPRQFEENLQLLDELLPFLVMQHSQVSKSLRFAQYHDMQTSGQEVVSSGVWFGTSTRNDKKMVHWWEQEEGPWLYGYFHHSYKPDGSPTGKASPYYDGESLLAIVKATKYLGDRYIHLWPMATATARALHKRHVVDALKKDEDSDDTKGVYQWLSMCLFELSTVTFGEGFLEEFDLPMAIEPIYGQEEFGTWLLEMAHWQVDVHKTLKRKRNTGYAYEGMVPAWTWASHLVATRDDNTEELQATAQKIQCTIEKGLSKLISWQVGMGVEKDAEDWNGVMGLGGIQNAAHESGLRIDVTQHQMHATILTRRLVYPPTGGEAWPWSAVELSQQ